MEGPEHEGPPAKKNAPKGVVCEEVQHYAATCRYFVVGMMHRWQAHPAQFRELMQHFDINENDVDAGEAFQKLLEKDFDLGSYLASNVAEGIRDSIRIHCKTWVAMIVLFGVFVMLHRFAHLELRQLMPGFVGMAVLILLAMHIIVVRRERELHKKVRSSSGCKFQSRHRARWSALGELPLEMLLLRVLQVVVFVLAYTFARDLLSRSDWEEDPTDQVIFTGSCFVVLLVLASWMPSAVPRFIGVMAMPPYVDDENFRAFCDLLIQQQEERDVQVVRRLTRSQLSMFTDPTLKSDGKQTAFSSQGCPESAAEAEPPTAEAQPPKAPRQLVHTCI